LLWQLYTLTDCSHSRRHSDYFTGKLTHTWPKTFDQIPLNVNPASDEKKGSGGTPLFENGYGLKY
jgi:hypothetical protein